MNINNLLCLDPAHNGGKINTVCMNKTCIGNRLCCLKCLVLVHNTHLDQWIEIDNIKDYFYQDKNKLNNPTIQLIKSLEQVNTLIDSLQKIIKEEISKLQKENLSEFLQCPSNIYQSNEYWNDLIESIIQQVEIKGSQLIEKQQSHLEQEKLKIIKQCEERVQNIIQIIQISSLKSKFEDKRKNINIELIDECTMKKINESSYAMAFAQQGFNPSNQSYSCVFNIQNIANCVWVGVGNDEGNDLPSYILNKYESLGHGQYMISFNNYTYHHTNEKFNDKYIGMTFKDGDQIEIKYSHITKVLEFKKLKHGNITVQMAITDMTKTLYRFTISAIN